MSIFKSMSFNVKPVRDDTEVRYLSPEDRLAVTQNRIDAAQAYSEIAQEFVMGIASTVVAATCTIIITKGAFDVMKAVANSIGSKK